MRWLWLGLLVGCVDGKESGTDTDCDVHEQSCEPDDSGVEGECPDGYACSGIPAYWCYRGDGCNPPICLPPIARIATPRGEVPIAELTPDATIWTVDPAGHRVEAAIARLGSTAAPVGHEVVELRLADGRQVRASPGHPLTDGRRFDAIAVGDRLDGSTVVTVRRVAYDHPRTYDVLPEGPTGAYWADGVLVGSTLAGPGHDRRDAM